MVSKYCPLCDEIITVAKGMSLNYCPYGHGSLQNEPVLREFKTYKDRLLLLEEIRQQRKQFKENTQLKLF